MTSALDLRAVSDALRKTTERLAAELAESGTSAPDWTPFEWQVAQAAVTLHGVASLLAHSLRWCGPAGWQQFLETQSVHTAKHYERMRVALATLSEHAAHAGIPVLPLKGCALYAAGLYEPGTRPMADLDLLIREPDDDRTCEALAAAGFREIYANERERAFVSLGTGKAHGFGEHADNPIKVELHRGIWERLPHRRVDVSHVLFPVSPHPGANSYRSRGALMSHLLLHAAGAMVTRSVRLLNLQDIARLTSQMTPADWRELFAQDCGWAWPPLNLAARYFPGIPDSVLNTTKSQCSRALVQACRRSTLSDLSLSALWLVPFPGIQWAQSPREIAAYVLGRVRPSANHLQARQTTFDLPFNVHSSWARASQLRRIMLWARSPQPRTPTLHAVRAALALAQ